MLHPSVSVERTSQNLSDAVPAGNFAESYGLYFLVHGVVREVGSVIPLPFAPANPASS